MTANATLGPPGERPLPLIRVASGCGGAGIAANTGDRLWYLRGRSKHPLHAQIWMDANTNLRG
jgi:hypothetical protein